MHFLTKILFTSRGAASNRLLFPRMARSPIPQSFLPLSETADVNEAQAWYQPSIDLMLFSILAHNHRHPPSNVALSGQCWLNALRRWPAFNQHWLNLSCFLWVVELFPTAGGDTAASGGLFRPAPRLPPRNQVSTNRLESVVSLVRGRGPAILADSRDNRRFLLVECQPQERTMPMSV